VYQNFIFKDYLLKIIYQNLLYGLNIYLWINYFVRKCDFEMMFINWYLYCSFLVLIKHCHQMCIFLP